MGALCSGKSQNPRDLEQPRKNDTVAYSLPKSTYNQNGSQPSDV